MFPSKISEFFKTHDRCAPEYHIHREGVKDFLAKNKQSKPKGLLEPGLDRGIQVNLLKGLDQLQARKLDG